MNELVLALLGAAGALAWTELQEWLPWIARKIVNQAVLALPKPIRARMEEEFTAEVSAVPGKISPFLFACSLWWGLWRNNLLRLLDVKATTAAIRGTDLVLSYMALTFASPLLLAAALAMKLATGHSGLMQNPCRGKNATFNLLFFAFRDRKTRKPLRWSQFANQAGIQYLPSLINVLRGEMSLVGPPPTQARSTEMYQLEVRPGLFWVSQNQGHLLDGYGETTVATMRVYFNILLSSLSRLLLK
jgi:Bacterial sugar transferase